MDEQQYYHRVDAFLSRLDDLLARSEPVSPENDRISPQAFLELQTLAEELQVASEELRQKNEELSSANSAAEADRWRYQELFEFAPDGYLVTDTQGVIREVNRTAAQLLQVEQDFLRGKPLAAFIFQEDMTYFRKQLSALASAERALSPGRSHWDVRIQPRKGDAFNASITVATGETSAGQADGSFRWLIRDVTEVHQARQALQAAKDDLELRVAERTAQLRQANENLKRFAFQLERRNRELQDFAFIASHDLQEPLRKIQSFGNLLSAHKRSSLGKDGEDYVRRMVDAAGRMQAMVIELLQYARINTRGDSFEPVNLAETASGVLADLETRIVETGGHVRLGSLPTIEADPMQMRQLFLNLIGNALKFHRPDSAPQVKVWVESSAPDAVAIHVQDNGIGMDPQHVDQIFQPFHRLHGRSEYEGTGMGLSICRKIVERHNGHIRVMSQPAEGSTFIVTLPIDQGSQDLPRVEI